MSQNKLVLNGDKTHLLVMASLSKHRKHQNFGITLDTGSEEIEPISSEKLLGAKLSNNFTWNLHIRDDDHSMFRTLTCKINALYKISLVTSFKTRKMVASGLILSTLNYIIQVYGGCSGYLLKMLQVLQNKAARIVTKLPWMTPTSVLLTQCGWLSVLQLIKYHSLVLMFKVKKDKRPHYLYEKIGATAGRSTRQEEERLAHHMLKDEQGFETATALKSYVPRTRQLEQPARLSTQNGQPKTIQTEAQIMDQRKCSSEITSDSTVSCHCDKSTCT